MRVKNGENGEKVTFPKNAGCQRFVPENQLRRQFGGNPAPGNLKSPHSGQQGQAGIRVPQSLCGCSTAFASVLREQRTGHRVADEKFLRHGCIGLRSDPARVVLENRFAMAGSLPQADGPRDDRFVNLLGKVI